LVASMKLVDAGPG